MLLDTSKLNIMKPSDLQKALTVKEAKAPHKELPPGGKWVTMNGHHIYVKDGKILAGSVPAASGGAKKATKAQLTEHQTNLDAEAKKGKKKDAKTPVKPTDKAKPSAKPTATKPSGTKSGAKATSEVDKKKAKAQADAAKARADIDAIANKPKKTGTKVDPAYMAKQKQGVEDILATSNNGKKPTAKGATKADIEEMLKPSEGAKRGKPVQPKDDAPKAGAKRTTSTGGAGQAKPRSVPAKPTPAVEPKGKPATKDKPSASPKGKPKAAVADVRTEGQTNNELSYDVGQTVFGSRKDLASVRDDLNSRLAKGQSVRTVMASLESIDPGAAKKYCTKDNILQKFDWEAQHKQGVDLPVAMMKKLIFDRIQPKPDKDDPETRRQYAYAIEELHRLLTPINTMDDLKSVRRSLYDRMRLELPKHLVEQNRYLEYAKKKAAEQPSASDLENKKWDRETSSYKPSPITKKQWQAEKNKRIKEIEGTIDQWHENAKNPYHVLGEKLTNFFTDSDSANRTIDTVNKKNPKWDDYLNPEAKEQAPKAKRDQKARWERKMDNPYFRSGGRKISVAKPEDAVKQFGLRGVQFGHWVDDTSGKFHLLKASEAFQDMADTLGMKDKEVSLNGRLAIAFGARGVGGKQAASAHYESALRVINMTKEKGAGTLAHEWGHALDDIMADHAGVMGFASENPGEIKHPEVQKAYTELMDAIYKGDGTHKGTEKFLSQQKIPSGVYPSRRKAVMEHGLKPELVKHFLDEHEQKFANEESRLKGYLGTGYRTMAEKKLKNLGRNKTRERNELLHELMYHEYRRTGAHPEHIEIPQEGSEYLNRMQEEDGNSKPYYATGREMFARVFESWMEHTLNAKGTKNHYLVAGTSEKHVQQLGAPFPAGSERTHMFDKMGNLMKAIVSTGEIKKALDFDLRKSHVDDFVRDVERVTGKPVVWKPLDEFVAQLTATRNRYAYQVPHTVDASEVLYIPVNRLRMVYQTEQATNWDKVKENMEKMQAGQPLEPVVIGYDHDVHDGHHRWEAAKALDHTHVPCVCRGTNDLIVHAAKEKYGELWKSIMSDPTGGDPFGSDPNVMFRGVGQKELDFINQHGYVETKGKGNDGDKGKRETCFSNLFRQAEGYAVSNYTLYGETAAYVIALPKPIWIREDEHGELVSDQPVPFHVGTVIPIPNPVKTSEV